MEDVTLHDVLNAINEYASKNDGRWVHNDQRLDRIEATVDKLATATINLQDRMMTVEKGIKHLTEQHDMTFRRIDDFLHHLDRNDVEIVSLRSAYGRLDERLTVLEQARA